MNQQKDRPIGVFDSGVGGLTVAHAIKQLLPGESMIYFGDTAHLPYGEKSSEAILHYAERITSFLVEEGCKAVVIACNTASSVAYEPLQQQFGGRVLVMDVINPVVDHYSAKLAPARVGVIGTKATIQSGAYEKSIRGKEPEAAVVSLATPLFVPMIEEGFIFDDISNAIIRAYLSKEPIRSVEALILGCTHYPIIKNQISKFYNFSVEILDSATIVARSLRQKMEEKGLLREGNSKGEDRFYVSDYTPYFEKIAGMFFEEKINLQKKNLWNDER
jgi:glutamate racemase